MKLQGYAVLFALIVLPLVLVLTYYISLQVDTLTLQKEYSTKLLNATYDALSSFELNTANEDLSSVSDSLRTIIEASSNIFFNTLATNLGMSNSSRAYVEPYVPALLYTLYDGYYIYAPTQVPQVLTNEDGVALTIGDPGVVKNTGTTYKYLGKVHTSKEEQILSCGVDEKDCSANGHISYDEFKKRKLDFMVDYEHLDAADKDSFGQLLYVSKKGTNTYTSRIEDARLYTKNILKTYVPYSAKYHQGTGSSEINVTVVYTLDNYVSIEGTIGEDYFTESGYLIPNNSVTYTTGTNLTTFNQNDAEQYIREGNQVKLTIGSEEIVTPVPIGDTNIRTYDQINEKLTQLKNNLKTYEDYYYGVEENPLIPDTEKETERGKAETAINNIQKEMNNYLYKLQVMDAVSYYVKADIFSRWIYSHLGGLRENSIIEISGQSYGTVAGVQQIKYDFQSSPDTALVFKTDDGEEKTGLTEIRKDCSFYSHKLNIIQDSIQYNLNLAMSTYNKNTSYSFQYAMPVMSPTEWDRILTNVSVVAFMQGYKCRLKTFNDYAIASSVNNEIAINDKYLYFTELGKFGDSQSEYHSIDCPRLIKEDTGEDIETQNCYPDTPTLKLEDADLKVQNASKTSDANMYMSFTSKDVKYDKFKMKTDTNYYYDHKNLACYKCILDGNHRIYPNRDKDHYNNNIFDKENTLYGKFSNLRKAYYIAVGNARDNLYKMNGFRNSEGFEMLDDKTSNRDINEIKAIEIVFKTIKSTDSNEPPIRFLVKVAGEESSGSNDSYAIEANITANQTSKIVINPNIKVAGKLSRSLIYFDYKYNESVQPISHIYSAYNSATDVMTDYAQRFNQILHDSIISVKVIYK